MRRELGTTDQALAGLAARASLNLRRAGRRAAAREEPAAAVRLLERSISLAPVDARAAILAGLARARDEAGEPQRALMDAREAMRLAEATADRHALAHARLIELLVATGGVNSGLDHGSAEATGRALIDEFEALGDDEGLARALRMMGYIVQDRSEEAAGYLERALVHAERAGDRLEASWAAGFLALVTVYGPLPVQAGIERCRALRERIADVRGQSAEVGRLEALLLAMRGDVDGARALHDEADRIIEDMHHRLLSAATAFTRANLELLAGAPERAASVAARLAGALRGDAQPQPGLDRCGAAGPCAGRAGQGRRSVGVRRPRRQMGRRRRHSGGSRSPLSPKSSSGPIARSRPPTPFVKRWRATSERATSFQPPMCSRSSRPRWPIPESAQRATQRDISTSSAGGDISVCATVQ